MQYLTYTFGRNLYLRLNIRKSFVNLLRFRQHAWPFIRDFTEKIQEKYKETSIATFKSNDWPIKKSISPGWTFSLSDTYWIRNADHSKHRTVNSYFIAEPCLFLVRPLTKKFLLSLQNLEYPVNGLTSREVLPRSIRQDTKTFKNSIEPDIPVVSIPPLFLQQNLQVGQQRTWYLIFPHTSR